jgi:hypothetical protein
MEFSGCARLRGTGALRAGGAVHGGVALCGGPQYVFWAPHFAAQPALE